MSNEWSAEPAQGYWLDFAEGGGGPTHEFGGAHQVPGSECPTCHKPLLRLLTLDSTDKRLNLSTFVAPRVHLLYCWTCSIPYGDFCYELLQDGGVNILSCKVGDPGAFGPDGPYDGYPGVFPGRLVTLKPLTEEEQRAIHEKQHEDIDVPDEFSYVEDPRHQIGGDPLILNPQFPLACPKCDSEMPFLATICDNAGGNGFPDGYVSFTGNLGVQMVFHLCRNCAVVCAYHSVD